MQTATTNAALQDCASVKLAPVIGLQRPAPTLGGGLLALMVTDIQGFTSLVEQLGDVPAQAVIRAHNRVLRHHIGAHGGREVTHTGDGFMVAFRSVAAALACAVAIQRGLRDDLQLREAELRIRIGLHAGEPLPEEERLFGQCVNVAVRVCSQARGGQVLVSDVVRQLAQGRHAFDSGALHALKGVTEPVRLYELRTQDCAAAPCPGAR